MKKEALLGQLKSAHSELTTLLAVLAEKDMTQPGVAARWSVKDILAHVAWYMREEAELISESPSYVPSPLWNSQEEQRNELLRQEFSDKTLDEVVADLEESFRMLVRAVDRLSDDDLVTPGRFPGTSEYYPPWQDIAANSFQHEREHLSMIQSRLESRATPGQRAFEGK